jgi:tRNA acetyltransferase TAN1
MTPSHKAKLAAVKGRSLEVGDMGFWVTCQRQKEMRAADEVLSMCDEV